MASRVTLLVGFFLLGVYSQVAQGLLIRETLVAFYGNEITVGIFYASWLWWTAVGSISMILCREFAWARRPLPALRYVLIGAPLVLAIQVLASRGVRWVMDVPPIELVPLGQLLGAVLAVTAPGGILLGLAFPLAARALRPEREDDCDLGGSVGSISRLYILDALGALVGGALFTFVMIETLGVWSSLGVLSIGLGIASLWLQPRSRIAAAAAVLVAAVGVAILSTPLGEKLERATERLRFAALQPGLEWVDSVDTRYGHVALGRSGPQLSLVTNGSIGESFPSPRDAEQAIAYFYSQAGSPSRVLLFGGVAGGLVDELLRYGVRTVDVVVEDRLAFDRFHPYLPETTRKALADPRVRIAFGDGRRVVRKFTGEEAYDLVLVLHGDPASAYGNRYFTKEFYLQLRRGLAPSGVVCTSVSSASNYLGREVSSYSGSVFHTLRLVFPYLAIAPGDEHSYCAASEPGRVTEDSFELERRYRATPLDEHRFPPESFYSLMPRDRIAFVRAQLAAEAPEINSDARPVTYYLNMVLWGKFSASGIVSWLETLRTMGRWPYLVPLLVLVAVVLLRALIEGFERSVMRRQSATLALWILGLVAMALQLALLLAYQSQLGFMFSRVALLNGVFMTGLAVGAGAIGQRLTRVRRPGMALAWLMAIVALASASLPNALGVVGAMGPEAQELSYLALCAVAGLITGTGFPLGVHQAHTETSESVRSSGLMAAADNLGGALGGLVTGALLVPLLGIRGACEVLAWVSVLVALPLLIAEYLPEKVGVLVERGYRTFPWSRLSWALVFLVASSYWLTLLAERAQQEPLVHFDQQTLEEISGSERFELREAPFPHYLGRGGLAGTETVSLASRPVAARVRGYAGPVDLLVSVGNDGRLLGVRYLDSDETPAYIFGIQEWIDGLAGIDLTSRPLSLDEVDGFSGATVTSKAVLETVNEAARAGGQAAFGASLAPRDRQRVASPWFSPAFLATAVLLVAFFPVYLSGSEPARLVYQGASLVVLGLWLNTLVTEIDVVNLSLGHVAQVEDNPQRWLLLGFVGVTAVLFGPVWCGYVCPFGALQEILSRIGRFFYLRSYPDRQLETGARYLKYLLLAALLITVWVSGDSHWAAFNPMQHAFGGKLGGWMLAIVVASLAGALFHYRFWCRYFCPFGALLALSNKLALLRRLAPKRRFDHCDLGVRAEFDVDCIRCSRCLTGADYGQRPKRKGAAAATLLGRSRSGGAASQ